MKLYATSAPQVLESLRNAVLTGLAPGGGLFMPQNLPRLKTAQIEAMRAQSLPQIGTQVLQALIGEDIPPSQLEQMVYEALNFPIPLVDVGPYQALELFHGPTLAFKDVGARFMARLLQYFLKHEHRTITVLAATSGDTGSAVAQGFAGVAGIQVKVLYPKGKISPLQKQQIATVGGNVMALEVEGAFDDCQALVKQALADQELAKTHFLTTANSINIARLLPQAVYYFYAWSQLPSDEKRPLVISVPSGNFGNLTAGLLAWRMGLPVSHFIAATNANDAVPRYLQNGQYQPTHTIATISNAMDVGKPSNFERMRALFNQSHRDMAQIISGYCFGDDMCRNAIATTFQNEQYTLDPHGAVGLLGLQSHHKNAPEFAGIFLGTAHPAKFRDVVEPIIKTPIKLPKVLEDAMSLPTQSTSISNDYQSFRQLLTD